MKKTTAGSGLSKLRSRMTTQQIKANAAEAGLKARRAKAVKAIAIGSAALGIITLSLFATRTPGKKRSWFS